MRRLLRPIRRFFHVAFAANVKDVRFCDDCAEVTDSAERSREYRRRLAAVLAASR
ncbi:hypothetical protein [Streptomyces ochraceiscleroticus]|uniref:Uncharacterized protein n=1 Tax=Streptomyces ochraceiscleroticus TaxID=47761 RepID=A0ABW1MLC6_9ACTN|nr:hypothetical protein [Streptomyces ochraceiscleroticus]